MKFLHKAFSIASMLALLASSSGSANNPFLKGEATVLKGNVDNDNSKAVIILMDASGSMAEPAPSANSKMLMAKQVLEQVLAKIDPSVPVGLRVYGSSPPSESKTIACQDSVLLVPVGTGNRAQMINKLRGIKPSGATPISYSLRKAIDDLKHVDAKKKSVVLISDGMETCGYDPCSLARNFQDAGIDVQFNVVGFGLHNDFQAIEQLQCIAKSTDGKFYTADTAAQLSESVLDGINHYSPSINTVEGKLKEVKK